MNTQVQAKQLKQTIKLQLDLVCPIERSSDAADIVISACKMAGYSPCKVNKGKRFPVRDLSEAEKFVHKRIKSFVMRTPTFYGSAIPLYDNKYKVIDRCIDILHCSGDYISISIRENRNGVRECSSKSPTSV